MKEVEVTINPQTFPSQYVTDSEKNTKEFGLRIGQAIQYEWFRNDHNGKFFSQWEEFHKLRLYARAEQSTAKYKNELAVNGDLSYMNVDWSIVPIIPKFIDIVVNGAIDRKYEIKAFAQDAMSADRRNRYQKQIEADMVSKDLLNNIKQNFGVDAFSTDPGALPNDDEELQLHMQLNYKPAIEIAEEIAINTIFEENKFDDIRRRLLYDATTLGVCMAKHQFLPGHGVKVDYVDPANVVYSYTEDPNFNDCFYWGEIKTVPTSELIKIDPTLTKDDLEKIAQHGQAWYNKFKGNQYYDASVFSQDTTTLLYFNYKTNKKFVVKKKIKDDGSESFIKKSDDWNPGMEDMEKGNFERVERNDIVWYDGVMVMGTNFVLDWRLSKNMVRPKSAGQDALPNYMACAPRMYKGNIESLLRRMMPFGDLIQLTHIKLQQVIQKVVPDGVFIDADGINEVDLGNGAKYTPEDALRLYFQTGSVIGRSYTQDGEFNNARVPIQELSKNSGQAKIASLVNSYNHYLQMLRDVTGLNEARDGSSLDPDSLVGVQKLAALNSNTATRHIGDSVLDVTRDLATAMSLRISDIMENADFRDEFAMKIGRYNLAMLEDIKDLHMHDFGIYIEMSPDEDEKQQLEANIQIALSRELVDLDDVIDIRNIKNIKLANQLLKIKKKRRQDDTRGYEMQKIQQQQEANMQSQQMAAQIAAQKIQMEAQAKMQVEQAKAGFELEKLRGEAELKSQLMRLEFDMNMQLRGVDADIIMNKENAKEDRKDDRIKMTKSAESKLIEQRKKGIPPINFESNEDSLDGFDFSEFEPR